MLIITSVAALVNMLLVLHNRWYHIYFCVAIEKQYTLVYNEFVGERYHRVAGQSAMAYGFAQKHWDESEAEQQCGVGCGQIRKDAVEGVRQLYAYSAHFMHDYFYLHTYKIHAGIVLAWILI